MGPDGAGGEGAHSCREGERGEEGGSVCVCVCMCVCVRESE